MASEHPAIMIGPRALILSDKNVPRMTNMNPAMFGGTVNSWAMTLLYPRLEMILYTVSESACPGIDLQEHPRHEESLPPESLF